MKCWIGNLDGRREALVIAASQKRAAVLLGISLYSFRQWFCQVNVPPDLRANTLYTRRFSGLACDPWKELADEDSNCCGGHS